MTGFRVLVTGSRQTKPGDVELIHAKLNELLAEHPGMVVVHGGADGVDSVADRWARPRRVKVERYPAEWHRGGGAGHIRNAEMVAAGADLCVAVINPCVKNGCREPRPHGSHGATGCRDLAVKAGIPVWPPVDAEPAQAALFGEAP